MLERHEKKMIRRSWKVILGLKLEKRKSSLFA